MAESNTVSLAVATPSVSGVTDAPWFNQVASVFASYSVPNYIWLPIMMAESGGRPTAIGDSGMSGGLFQLYTGGGQGDGYTVNQLLDPVLNAQLAAPAIARAYQEFGDNLTMVAAYSGHPNALSAGFSEIANNIIPQLQRLFPSVATKVAGGPGITAASSGGNTSSGGTPSGDTPSGGTSNSTPDATAYSFSNGILHLLISLVLIVIGLVAIYYGLTLVLGSQIGGHADSIGKVIAETGA